MGCYNCDSSCCCEPLVEPAEEAYFPWLDPDFFDLFLPGYLPRLKPGVITWEYG